MAARRIHFIGIGGIGMSALAQCLQHLGDDVSGSDREASPVTELLESKGIKVVIGQRAENVPEGAATVVYSDAVPADNPERARATELGVEQLSYFAMLGKVAAGKRTVAVAGTHGKTTTTGMLAKILADGSASLTAIIGSIVRDFGSNYVSLSFAKATEGTTNKSDLFVVEACEYRDHLLELTPEILVLTNVEWEHTDWFPSLAAVQATFRKAMLKVPAHGAIVTDPSHPNIEPLLEGLSARVIDYTKEPAYELRTASDFNRANARAAAAAARLVEPRLTNADIAKSLAAFEGAWRRFEFKGKTKAGADVYDDYAHHPTAIRETLHTLREKSKGKIFVAFHPHLYSRTRDLLDGFARAFADADEILIAPIYAAREIDDGSVSNEILAERIRKEGRHARAATFEEIERILNAEAKSGDVIMTMGAGDIYKVADKLVA